MCHPPLFSRDGAFLGDEVALLAKIGWDFAAETADLGQTLNIALRRVLEYLEAEAGSIFLLDEENRHLVCKACAGPLDITGLQLAVDHGIVGRTITSNCLQVVRDVAKDTSFTGIVDAQTGFCTRSILCAPLQVRGKALGAIEVINKKSEDGLFSTLDAQLLAALAALAALAIHNARMAADLVEQERLKKELELAGEIQRSLLPRPRGVDFPIHGLNVSALEVSGDFYHYFELPDGRMSFCLGDVSGKGMNASLLMAKTISLFHCLAKTVHQPGALLSAINDEVTETATRGMFVTMVAGLYDPHSQAIIFANAGHQPPLFHDKHGSFQAFEAQEPPLGIVAGLSFSEQQLTLDGGYLYLFSDGLTEGKLEDGTPLGEGGVRSLIEALSSLPLPERLQQIVAHLDFPGARLHDDITLLGVGLSISLANRLYLEASPDCLPEVRAATSAAARSAGFDEETAENLSLAVNEAVMNVIQHGYRFASGQRMVLEIRQESEALVFCLMDHASPVSLESLQSRPLDEIRPGGLGVYFMRSIMDELRLCVPPQGFVNCLQLRKFRKKDSENGT